MCQKCQNVSFSIKDVWTEKLLVVAFNLATPGHKNPIGTCSLWHLVPNMGLGVNLPKSQKWHFCQTMTFHTKMTGKGTQKATQSIFFEHSIFQVGAGSRISSMVQEGARVSQSVSGCPRRYQDVPGGARIPRTFSRASQVPQARKRYQLWPATPGLRRRAGDSSCCPGDCWRGPCTLYLWEGLKWIFSLELCWTLNTENLLFGLYWSPLYIYFIFYVFSCKIYPQEVQPSWIPQMSASCPPSWIRCKHPVQMSTSCSYLGFQM